jgi:hypothetical protein
MKTPEEWMEEWFPSNDSPNWPIVFTKAHIEDIQRDALNSPFANTTDQKELELAHDVNENLGYQIELLTDEVAYYKAKWHEARRYLRAANKGAQRNAEALALSQNHYWELVSSDKRYKERDENQHKTVVWNWLVMSDEDLTHKIGEHMTPQELRLLRLLLRAMLGSSLIPRPKL